MRDTRIVWWVRLEADRKDIIAIIARDVQVVGASLVVLEVQSRQLQLGNMLGAHQGEAMELLADLGEQAKVSDSLASCFGSVAQHYQ